MKVGSLCSGIDGLALGLEAHGMKTVWQSEVDPYASSQLARHWDVPNHGDLTTTDWTRVEPVDLVCAGYPCQPFSHAGKRKGTDDERHLWPHIRDALRVLRPRYVVGENVAGHLSLGFDAVTADLSALGYCVRWTVLRASDVGAPHRRERLFWVATDSGHRGRHAREGVPGGLLLSDGAQTGRDEGAGSARARHQADADAPHVGHERPGDARRWGTGPADGGDAAADAHGVLRGPGGHRPVGGAPAGSPRHAAERQWLRNAARGGREAAADADRQGPQGAEPAGRRHMPAGGGDAAADATRHRWDEGWPEPAREQGRPDAAERRASTAAVPDGWHEPKEPAGDGPVGEQRSPFRWRTVQPAGVGADRRGDRRQDDDGGIDWGPYAAAIVRWERVIGRPAPAPLDERGRLNPDLAEWMMGFPEGWTEGKRTDRLRVYGNAVVPQQAFAAWALLTRQVVAA